MTDNRDTPVPSYSMQRWRSLPNAQAFIAAMVRIDGRLAFVITGGAREPIEALPSLDVIADDPLKATDLSPAHARTLFLRAVVALNALLPSCLRESVAPAPPTSEDDRLLNADETAARLGVTVPWLYRHKLPFRVHLGGKALQFSEHGLRKYLATKARTPA